MEAFIQILNQLFDIQDKLVRTNNMDAIERNFNRIINICEEQGFVMHNPIHEKYTETRTDCEANIIGNISKNMQIVQVIKPIIFKNENNINTIVQKAIVMVQAI